MFLLNNMWMKNKSNVVIVIVALFIISLAIIFIFTINKSDPLDDRLKKIANDFYAEFYYPIIEDQEKYLSHFSDNGININLDNLSKYHFQNLNMIEELEHFNNCDLGETKVII